MATSYTSLLGLALPVTGELSGTWGDTVNNSITSLLDSAIAGTTTLSTDADVTLTTTTGAANTAREAILLFSGARTALRTITAPAQSKIYTVINSTTGGFSVKVVGAGPTTGVTIVAGTSAQIAWNGSDFVLVSTLTSAGVLPTANGGTGLTSFTANQVFYASSTSAFAQSTNLQFSGTDLTVYGLTVGRGAGAVSTNTAVGASALAGANTGGFTTAIGYQAGYSNTSGQNSLIGANSGQYITTGTRNTGVGVSTLGFNNGAVSITSNDNSAFGHAALTSLTSGAYNTAVGSFALLSNTTASSNTAVGYQSLYTNTTGANNSALGLYSLQANTTGQNSVAIGVSSLLLNTTGSYNTAIGLEALRANTTASNNTAVGYQAGYTLSAVANQTFLGYQAGYSRSTGADNYSTVMIGNLAGYSTSTGIDNTYIGGYAARFQTGSSNTALGGGALYGASGTSTGSSNTAVGYGSLLSNTTASSNTAVGYQAMYSTTTGNYGTAVGYQALYSQTNNNNDALGYQAAYNTTTGYANVAIGQSSLRANQTGIYSVAVGALALNSSTGSYNVGLGGQALYSNTTASNNTAVGYQAGYNQTVGTLNTHLGYGAGIGYNTGSYNVSVGAQAGVGHTTGSYNIAIGYNLYESSSSVSNSYTIGSNIADGGANTIQIGNGSGYIKATYTSSATWSFSSDERVKANIQPDTLGLSFINKLQPKKYNWKPSNELPQEFDLYREENLRDTNITMHGLIAQNVKAALDAEGVDTFEGWSTAPDGMQMVSREMFVLPLINAVNELTEMVNQLKSEIATLKGA